MAAKIFDEIYPIYGPKRFKKFNVFIHNNEYNWLIEFKIEICNEKLNVVCVSNETPFKISMKKEKIEINFNCIDRENNIE